MKKIFPLLMFLFLIMAGCSDNSTDPPVDPPANEIWIQGNSFRPASISIAAGVTLTWVNKDNITHTVTSGSGSPSGTFDSGNLAPNASFSFTFDNTNSFPYYCKIHPSMTGTVTVQ